MSAHESSLNTVTILGTPVHTLSTHDVLDHLDQAISERRNVHIGVVNAAKLVNMGRDETLKASVLASDLILPDGIAVVWASKLLGTPLEERVTGIDLMSGLLQRGQTRGYRVFCLGATEAVSEKVASEIARLYPGTVLAGRRNGYFTDDEEAEIAQSIARSQADILFVAITSPKKERFMAKWNDTMQVPIVHGVGGSFDVMAGLVERAPERWQKLGLEWLYRVKQEPGRLWKRYLVTNTRFLWQLSCAFVRQRLLRRPAKQHTIDNAPH